MRVFISIGGNDVPKGQNAQKLPGINRETSVKRIELAHSESRSRPHRPAPGLGTG
jgi:hypothetical protein